MSKLGGGGTINITKVFQHLHDFVHKTFLYFNKFNPGKNIVLRVHPLMSHFATCKDSNGNWEQYFEKSMSGPL